MSRKQNNRKERYDLKTQYMTYAKRYIIILLIAVPIIMFFCFFLSNEFGISSTAVVFITLALLLLALFIGIVVFTKKDEKKRLKASKESERDPFAD